MSPIRPSMHVMLIISLSILTIFSPGRVEAGPSGGEEKGRVTVVVVDSFGKRIGDYKIISFEDEHRRDLSHLFRQNVGEGVPVGLRYRMRIQFGSGGAVTQEVVVNRSDFLLVLAFNPLSVDYLKGRVPVLKGSLINLPIGFGMQSWVRLCGLFIARCEVAELDRDGHFSFVNVTPAAYTIELLSSTGHAVTERVDIEDPSVSLVFDPNLRAGERVTLSGGHAP